MKKIFTILMVMAALLFTGINVDAQKKGSSKSSSSSITVKKNSYGYPDPTGHTYKAMKDGVTMLWTFEPSNSLEILVKVQGESVPVSGYWEQDDNVIYMECPITSGYITINSSGKVLTDEAGDKMNIVK